MRRILLPIVLGLLGFGLFVTSLAMAASNAPPAVAKLGDSFQVGDPVTDTDTISPTTSISHPVASAIADYFGVDYSEIAALHEEGLGFGVIAHAYFIAGTLGITPTDVISEFQSGVGWGVILKEYGLHPGLAGRGGNLGSIMSGRDRLLPPGQLKKLPPSGEVETFVPPGQLKEDQPQGNSDFVPPGQLRKSGGEDGDERGGPPGHARDNGDKDKKH